MKGATRVSYEGLDHGHPKIIYVDQKELFASDRRHKKIKIHSEQKTWELGPGGTSQGTAIYIIYMYVRNRRLRNFNDKFADIPETLFQADCAQAEDLRA